MSLEFKRVCTCLCLRENPYRPFSLPSKWGLMATSRPGCGSRKQPMLEKQLWICFLTFCSSSCWFCFTYREEIKQLTLHSTCWCWYAVCFISLVVSVPGSDSLHWAHSYARMGNTSLWSETIISRRQHRRRVKLKANSYKIITITKNRHNYCFKQNHAPQWLMMEEHSKEQHWLGIEIFCNIINVFTVPFDQYNVFLLNKTILNNLLPNFWAVVYIYRSNMMHISVWIYHFLLKVSIWPRTFLFYFFTYWGDISFPAI